MAKKITILLLFTAVVLNAQNQQFLYMFKAITDSTNKTQIYTDTLTLDVKKDNSLFFSVKTYKIDSIMTSDLEKQISAAPSHIDIDMRKYVKGKLNRNVVEKDFGNNKVYFFTSIGMSLLKVLDDRPMNWRLSAEKSKIGDYPVQKATLNFAGRKWTAWFTPEIAIQDGPFKFHGLPGLILKISDDTGSYSFEWIGTKKLSTDQTSLVDKWFQHKKGINMGFQEYKKMYKQDREHPESSLMTMQSVTGTIVRDASGNPIDQGKFMRDFIERKKKSLEKNNNPLDMDLIQ